MSPDSKPNNDVTGDTEKGAATSPENSDEVDGENASDSQPISAETTGPTGAGSAISPPSIKRKATGPRTAAGKRRSRRNALKSGIFAKSALLPDESPAEFNALLRVLRDAYQPLDAFMEMTIERMAVNLWQQRRVQISEIAEIEEVRKGYTFRSEDGEQRKMEIVVRYEGQEDDSPLMETTPARQLTPRERCLQLLRDLTTRVQSSGFDSKQDLAILAKLYGSLNNDNGQKLLINSYQTWQTAAARSEEERLEKGSASPGECVAHFVKDVAGEIKRLENQSRVDLDMVKLRRLRQLVPDYRQSDHRLRRLTTLERSFDRLVAQLERHRRMLLGQPVPPQIGVHHSVSHD